MKIIVRQSRNKQWRFYFIAANGEKVVTSEQYKNKRDAVKSAELVKTAFVGCAIEIEGK